MELYDRSSDEWHVLVHVCRRWRYLAFTSPRHLNLQLLCKLPRRSVKQMLDIWPELPIFMEAIRVNGFTMEERDDCIAALRLNHRVSGIHLEGPSDSILKTFVSRMQRPFPALTYLWVRPNFSTNAFQNGMSPSFLGGSAPALRVLVWVWFPFPTLPELLLSTTNLVRLCYDLIPRSGYISPQAMATALSELTQLESLSLTSPFPDWHPAPPGKPIRFPPPHTRTPLPALTHLRFQGDAEYFEDLVAQIDTPLLESLVVTIFRREVIEVSQLAKFVRRSDKLSLLDQAEVAFKRDRITLNLSQELRTIDPKFLRLNLLCHQWALQLSHLTQFCESCLPTLSSFETLLIHNPTHYMWRDVIDDPDPQWLELLHFFHAVKDLRLSKHVALHIGQILRGLPVERVSEVLPALETVFITGLESFGPVKEAISAFADMRRLSGHPLSICDWEEDHDVLDENFPLFNYK